MSEITAVGYARRSTDMQERSIPDQQAYVEQWAKEHGYVIKRWYVDDAISGTSTKDRDAFERMIRDGETSRDFSTVLCYDISRFSRGGTNETGFFLHRLKLVGVEVVFTADGIPEGDEGELLQGVKSWQARQYSVKLSRDVLRGEISSIMVRHSTPGGAPPFGYDKQHVTADGRILRTFRWLTDGRKEEYDSTGKLVRVLPQGEWVQKAKSDIIRYVPSTPERVAIIKLIFETVADGYGSRHIANKLNFAGVTGAYGGKWSACQVRKIIANPVYRGALVWNKRTMGKLHGVGRDGKVRPRRGTYGQRNNARADWFMVDDVHEPLVSRELFDKVQQIQESRRHMGGAAKTGNRSLLSGLMVCTRCGWHFGQRNNIVYSRKGERQGTFRYYIDRGYHTGGKSVCTTANIPADAMDDWVVGKVKDVLLGGYATVDAAIDVFVKQVLVSQEKPTDNSAAEKELEAITKRIKAMLGMLADPSFEGLDELKSTLADLKAKRDSIQAMLEKAKPSKMPLKESDLRTWAMQQLGLLDKVVTKTATIVEARSFIHLVVHRIEIDPTTRMGILYLPEDAYGFFMRKFSTMGALQEAQGGEEGIDEDQSPPGRLNPTCESWTAVASTWAHENGDRPRKYGRHSPERVGFEPTVPVGTLVFETSPFSRSGTSPLAALKVPFSLFPIEFPADSLICGNWANKVCPATVVLAYAQEPPAGHEP